MDGIESKVLEIKRLATLYNLRIACAESCTGGMIASCLTSCPGASLFFDRGFVAYSNNAKHAMLGVNQETIELYGAVSKQVASEMAFGAIKNVPGVGVAVATTGVIGPDSIEGKKVGMVYFTCVAGSVIHARANIFQGNRMQNLYATTKYALDLMIEAIRCCTSCR